MTPLSLGIETVDGYCEHVIARNATVPTEQVRMFTTARDNQRLVHVRICQGESRRLRRNQELGVVALHDLRPARRGQVQIAVTFAIDADGTLDVSAKDTGTGKEQHVTVDLIGQLNDEQIASRKARQSAFSGEKP